MKRIGIFVDVSNLYYCVGRKFSNRKLDYRKYYKFVKDLGEIQVAIAYGSQIANQAKGFIHALKNNGFQPKFKEPKHYPASAENNFVQSRKADWDVGIAMDIVNCADRLDMVVLGSGDGDMMPVVDWCMAKGIDVIIMGCAISRELRDKATKYIEIPESLLEDLDVVRPG